MNQTDAPSCLILSRQALPTIDRQRYAAASGVARGAYVLAGGDSETDLILLASGSEVGLVIAAHEQLAREGIASRVVSMPSWSVFEAQDRDYRESVLPRAARARLAVEQAVSLGWDRYVGPDGATITMQSFGASAPYADLRAKFGFTVDHVCERARALLSEREERA
jgi:transketolase